MKTILSPKDANHRVIYFVRHGEALDDVEDRYGGWADDPLTNKGRQTAIDLAKKVASFSPKPTKIYTSTFKRAFETAKIIGSTLKLPVIKVGDLKERDRYGILTSLTKSEAKMKHPNLVEDVKDYMNTITGAETYEHYKERVLESLNKIIREGKEVSLVVCHGGTFRIIMWELLEKPNYNSADLNAVIILEEKKGKLKLKDSQGLNFVAKETLGTSGFDNKQ